MVFAAMKPGAMTERVRIDKKEKNRELDSENGAVVRWEMRKGK